MRKKPTAKREVEQAARAVESFVKTTSRSAGGKPTPAPVKRRAPSQVKDTKGDADRGRAKAHAKTPEYRKAAQKVYADQPVDKRKQIVRASKDAPKGSVGEAAVAQHRARLKFGATPAGKRHKLDVQSKRKLMAALDKAGDAPKLKHVQKRQTSGIPGAALKALGKELAGEGKAAAAFKTAGEFVADHVNPDGGFPTASKNLPGTKKITRNAVKDIVELPATAVTGMYLPAREVARGNVKGAAKMLVDPIVETAKHPVKSFEEHPVNTTLIASGAKGAVGRSTGKVLRVAGKMPKRAPKRLEGTRTVEPREYSRDAITAAGQAAVDKTRSVRARRVEKKAAKPSTPHAERVRLNRKAASIRKDTMGPRDIQRRVDENVALTEDVRRANRGETVKQARKIVGRKGRARSVATVLVSQNITKATKADLAAYRRELAVEHPNLSKSGKHANAELRRRIDRVLADPRTNFGDIEVAARKYAEFSRPLQDALVERGLLAKGQVDRAAVIPYAVRNMGAKHEGGKLVAKDGAELSTDAIRAHMKANRVSEPAFVSQAPNARGAKNFYVAADRDPRAAAARRTGRATKEGTFDASPEMLIEQVARAQGLKDAADGFRRFVDEFGIRSKSGKVRALSTYKQAQRAADELTAANGGATPYTPVRLNAFGTKKEQTEALLEQTAREPRAVHEAIERALEMTEDAPGPYVLIPEAAAKRLREHMRVGSTGAGKVADVYGSQFRKVVLSTSPKWIAGNVSETALRSAVSRSGPRSYVTGRKVIKKLRDIDPVKARELEARATSGGHFSLGTRAAVHRNAEHFAGTRLEPTAQALGKFWRAPGPKQAAGAWRAYTSFVMDTLNGSMEVAAQTAMLGKALRDSPLMERRVLKLGEKAITEAAEGLRNTNTQVKFAREVDLMYGKYGKFSPQTRRAIATYTPFAAWWLNSIRFVYSTLPRDHPILTGLIASANEASEEWRKSIGQMYGTDLPEFLWGSVPGDEGGWLRVSEFTPFGVTTTKTGPLGKAYSLILPQASGVGKALEGKDWLGRDLKTEDGRKLNGAERVAYATRELLGGTVPFLNRVKAVKDADSVVEGLNPFKETKPSKSGKQIRRAPRTALERAVEASSGPDVTSGLSQAQLDSLYGGKP